MFTIKEKDRTRHVYIPGTTQHGKSTLIYWMALQNIAKNRGVCVIDGKGDFMKKFLFRLIPDNVPPDFIPKLEARLDDIIYLDVETPVAVDFMSCKGEREKEKLIGELKFLLLKTVDAAHMPVIDTNLTNCLYTLFDYNENPDLKADRRATFLDIYRFFSPEHFHTRREEILGKLTHEGLRTQWRKAWPNAQDCARITTRVNSFDKSETLTKIFDAPEPKLNILDAMLQRKIIFLNIGPVDEIQKIYGTLILSKIRQAAFRRSELLGDNDKPENYYLYCDEFQEYQTSDFPKMIAQAGGLGLCLTLANQWMGQMETPVCDAVRTISTFIIFHLDPRDAYALKDHLGRERTPTPEEKTRDQRKGQLEKLQVELSLLRAQNPVVRDISKRIELSQLELAIQKIENDLRYLPRPPILPQEVSVSDIPMLNVGEAILKKADGSVQRIKTLKPPLFSRPSYADYIRNHTLEKYRSDTLEVACDSIDALGSMNGQPDKDGGPPNSTKSPLRRKPQDKH